MGASPWKSAKDGKRRREKKIELTTNGIDCISIENYLNITFMPYRQAKQINAIMK